MLTQGSPSVDTIMIHATRRDLLKLGTTSAAVLSIASSTALLAGCSRQPDAERKLTYLTAQDAEMVIALAPVMLNQSYPGSLGKDAEQRLLSQFDTIINTLDKGSRDLLIQLFDALSYAPIRLAMGAPFSWQDAKTSEIKSFLDSWRTSSFALKNLGYASLCKLICVSWYIQPETYVASGYPGPPQKIPMPVT